MHGTAPSDRRLSFSFEFFPPRTEAMEETLWRSIERLEPLQPDFVSVTYGAGGSTRERTHATIARILRETKLEPAAHLTCVAASRADVDEVIATYRDLGVKRMVALRGDPVTGVGTKYEAHPDGYSGSAELVSAIRRIGDFEVAVGTYPEKHPESGSLDEDIEILRRKVDAGASEAITHFFYDNEIFEAFVNRVRRAGITVPIVPGLMPINSFKQVSGFAAKAGGTIPRFVAERFERVGDDPEAQKAVAAELAAAQVHDLIGRGFRRIHFYTLNRAELVWSIYDSLGLAPKLTGRVA